MSQLESDYTVRAIRASLREVERHTVSARLAGERLAPIYRNEDTTYLAFVSRKIEKVLNDFREYWDEDYLEDLDMEELP